MTYPDFDKDLYGIYKSEVMGEALFSTAALLSRGERRGKWRALAALETQTRERYLAYESGRGQCPAYPVSSRVGGYLFGLLFALCPWRTAMSMLKAGTPAFIEQFQRLVDHAPPEDAPFFDYVLQHELAITRFAEHEMAGKGDTLADVERLLSGTAIASAEGQHG